MKKLNLILILTLIVNTIIAQDTLNLKWWNITNPQKINLPAFSDVKNIDGKEFDASSLLSSTNIDINSKQLNWKTIEVAGDSILLSDTSENNLVLLSTYLSVDRWTKSSLNISLNAFYELYIDNELIKTKKSTDLKNTKIDITLNSGNHKIVIKALSSQDNLKLAANFEYKEGFENCITTADNANRYLTIHDIMNSKSISASISPSGKYALINYSEVVDDSGKSKKHSVIYDLEEQKNFTVLRNKSIANVNWLPRTDRLSYSVKFEKKSEIFVYDIISGTERLVAHDISDLSKYSWAPTENFIIYSNHIKGEQPTDLKRIYGNNDRLPNFRDYSYLFKIDVTTGSITQLTTGNQSASLHNIKPDGSKILFSTLKMDYLEVPFRKQNMYEMDIETNELSVIWENKIYGGYASYSPDGTKLLVQAGPECFGELGVNMSEGRIPNTYDSQLYLFNIETKEVEPLTKDFNPAVRNAYWTKDNQLYISVTERDYRNLYNYSFKTKQLSKIDLSVEMLSRIDYAYDKAIAIYTGTSISTPNKLYTLNLKTENNSVINFPEKEKFANIKFGKTEPWNFTNKNETTIYGRVYYPPNYDAEKKYPVIVNYYGGTSPIGRSFGGRYPINIWAASGYIVYVLQPSGATGFGQDFSALHVNGWGFDAIDDVIDGTKKFLEKHPSADAENVGCIGASYGGYTTMLLQTRTNIFKTAVSHAGISSITSYWGEGYWGYSYSAGATKGSYPWNRKDIYVEHSPIYNADKFHNSILLLHGTADTNVPVGESLQFYAALKLLGKDVEMVLVEGENHWIVEYNKRIKWHYTIMSWFDKKLKDQAEQWDDLYPEKNL